MILQSQLQRGDPMLSELLRLTNRELQLRPAREEFLAFWKLSQPGLLANWFHELLAAELQQFYEDVLAGKQPRLMIFAPPRHGKTEGAGRRFPAWAFGKKPDLHIISTSYAAPLAMRTNRDVQRIMDSEVYQEIFPEARLNTENVATLSGKPLRNSNIFEIVEHLGSYRSAGVGGGITGQGFDIGIIDDPLSNAADAYSDTVRESIWEWYQTTFYTRQSPRAGILLIMTRWHEDDLAGRLLRAQAEQEGADQWRIVSFPAIAEQDEEHRKVGEALQPERYPLPRLEQYKATLGSFAWGAMFQQHPTPRGGTIFRRDQWKYWKVLPQVEEMILSVDCAFKDLQGNDYVALHAWARAGANKFLAKRIRAQAGFGATVQLIRSARAELAAKFPGKIVATLVEDKANGPAVIETLRQEIPGMVAVNPGGGKNVNGVAVGGGSGKGSKVARAWAMQPEQEAGNLFLPDPSIDHDIEQFLGEASAFPGGPYDDEVDAMTQAINWYRNRAGAMGALEYMRGQVEKQRALNGNGHAHNGAHA